MSLFDNVLILVCGGSEFKAVNKGLRTQSGVLRSSNLNHKILSLPIGINPVKKKLKLLNNQENIVLLIGLGGSLSPKYKVGDVLIYESCSYIKNQEKIAIKDCDQELNNCLKNILNVPIVKGITTDKLINSSIEKANLNLWGDVVDMESFAVMSHFKSVSVVRIISDNYDDNLPDLNSAINEEGILDNLKMSIVFIKEPIKALTLIKNALISLKKLEKITKKISIES
ncbi:hypothetical protein [Geminocystis sp. NIES-3709]|uniref:phosphorylase family protein n=1 Tax=Geminocystis sp. NIES-3709 TaxID=1617448 RepID=UPI0005FCCD7C|nr:hypothetical protein [Geminocystis sp. NIES-3709]BAQ66631.1 adenosylhopane nucleosidase [Geminocystis sp. NIES-3709]